MPSETSTFFLSSSPSSSNSIISFLSTIQFFSTCKILLSVFTESKIKNQTPFPLLISSTLFAVCLSLPLCNTTYFLLFTNSLRSTLLLLLLLDDDDNNDYLMTMTTMPGMVNSIHRFPTLFRVSLSLYLLSFFFNKQTHTRPHSLSPSPPSLFHHHHHHHQYSHFGFWFSLFILGFGLSSHHISSHPFRFPFPQASSLYRLLSLHLLLMITSCCFFASFSCTAPSFSPSPLPQS